MTNRNSLSQLPPSYIDSQHISTWLSDIFNGPFGLPCICSDQTIANEIHIVRPHIIDICQDPNSPSHVHIRFHLGTAHGIWFMDYSQSGFSLDTTDGVNGIWHRLKPDIGNASHNPSINNTSLAGTDSVDATWNYGLYNPNNPAHITNNPCLVNFTNLNIPVHTFVFDMTNDHLSTWLSETSVSFRLTFSRKPYHQHTPVGCVVANGF
jgi:hypothetical protein